MRRHLSSEHGFALAFSLVSLFALSIMATSVIAYSTSTTRAASLSAARMKGSPLSEAGINYAMSILANPQNNALDPWLFCPDGAAATPPCWTTVSLTGGTVRYTGLLTSTAGSAYWTLTSTSTQTNPTGPRTAAVRRTLTARVPVYPVTSQPLNNPSWNYIYATRPASPLPTCDMTLAQSVQVGSPLYVNGNLCLQNSATITRGPLVVRGRLTLNSQFNAVGSSSNRVSEAHIGNGCEWVWGKRLSTPCAGDVNNVWVQAGKLTSNPPVLAAPVPEWAKWYLNANPGPYFPCAVATGSPPVFDSPVAAGWATDDQKLAFRNNNLVNTNLTPASSYTCQTLAGELSWSASTRTLTVRGTMYIDGSAFVQNGAVNQYTGQGVLYLTGTLLIKNSSLCGALNAARTACDVTQWDPNSRLLGIIANGQGGQVPSGTGIQIVSGTFQGALQATHAVDSDTTSRVDGPMVGSTVMIGQSSSTSFPTITVVPVGMPSNPAVYAQPAPPQMYSG